jgi:hypothetical protein
MLKFPVFIGSFLFSCLCLPTVGWSSILARHEPAHPATAQAVKLSARAGGDVFKVSLLYDQYALSMDATGKEIQVPVGTTQLVRTCDAPTGATMQACEHEIAGGFPAASLIKFRAVASFKDGHEEVDTYLFAAGAYPFPDQPIPIRVTGDIQTRLDLVFIPDTDLTVNELTSGLTSVIYDLYFKYSWYVGTEEANYRNLYNFWYSGEFGNFKGHCQFDDPSNMAKLVAVGDAIAVLHKTRLRDCRQGKRFSAEINYDKTIVHESGHALFGLIDEYCCDTRYQQRPQVPNVWASLSACELDAPNLGYPKEFCTQIARDGDAVNFWRIDPVKPAPGCIMGPAEHRDPSSTYSRADARRILWTFEKCLSGSCANAQVNPASQKLEDFETRVHALLRSEAARATTVQLAATNSEPILALQLRITDTRATVERTELVRAPLPQGSGNAELRVRANARTSRAIYEYTMEDPRLAEIDGQGYVVLPEAKVWVFAPANTDLQSIELAPVEDAAQLRGRARPSTLQVEVAPSISRLCQGAGSLESCFRSERK